MLMGMFDTVHIMCPACGEITEFQSKYGKCDLNVYNLACAPLSILSDIKEDSDLGKLYCDKCNTKLKLEVETRVRLTEYSDGWFQVKGD